MKKLIYSILFICFTVTLLCENPAKLNFYGFHVEPTFLDWSRDDYMNGGYNGFAIRLQPREIQGPHRPQAVMTCMRSQNFLFDSRRQKRYAYALDKPTTKETWASLDITFNEAREGYGSLAIDSATGIPFYATHTWFDGVKPYGDYSSDFNTNSILTRETTNIGEWKNYFGTVISDRKFLVVQNKPEEEEFNYQWPVVFVGKSPAGDDHRRIYVFTANGKNAKYMKNIDGESGIASSAQCLSFADFNIELFAKMPVYGVNDEAFIENLKAYDPKTKKWRDGWHQYQIPFFLAMHNYDPKDNESNSIAIAFPSYAVQENGSGVAYAGNIIMHPEIWNYQYPWAENFVLFSDNFGEEDSWQFFPVNLSHAPITRTKLQEQGHEGFGAYSTDEGTSYCFGEFTDQDFTQDQWVMKPATLSHKTATFDKVGNIQFPTVYQFWYTDLNDDTQKGSLTNDIIALVTLNPRTNEITLSPIQPNHPQRTGTVTQPPTFGLPFDWDMDGWIDENMIRWSKDGKILAVGEPTYPVPHHNWDPAKNFRYHLNQLRTSIDNNGVMAVMWVDSALAMLADKNYYSGGTVPEIYEKYKDTPQLKIAISTDSGKTWSTALDFDKYTCQDIFNQTYGIYPAYIYPADRVEVINGVCTEYIVYFLLVNDLSYGPYTAGGNTVTGYDLGANFLYAAVHLKEGVSINDHVDDIPQMISLLQNYPNPFNPTTTIQFEIRKAEFNNHTPVQLEIFNIKGQKIRSLVKKEYSSGVYNVIWNGKDDNGYDVSSGVYFYKLTAGKYHETKKMVLMK